MRADTPAVPPDLLADRHGRAMSNQVPSVGLIVHYRARGSADGVFPPVCRAAVVSEVPANSVYADTVSLAVLNPTGLFFQQSTLHGPELEPGTWHWPGRDGNCEPGGDL